ncbi:hypothetical protein [[Mycoplasma] gypis]|uniref:Uncharacterized protein n=1 Tax=[Mycoplasma] gypis TaxID=92404 RepID=A0ABZ2RS60_9BACT|nr:hypothetical protein [[Mycoplasma] gypis]MBN0919638.1 hypothetical protein [[Mycoplasma] gypis]
MSNFEVDSDLQLEKLIANPEKTIKRNEVKSRILASEDVQEVVSTLNLTDDQINSGLHLLLKYKNFIEINKTKPKWKLFINGSGFLDIDWSGDSWYIKQKALSCYWLTSINSLDKDLEETFSFDDKVSKHNRELIKKDAIMVLEWDQQGGDSKNGLLAQIHKEIKTEAIISNYFFYTNEVFKVSSYFKFLSIQLTSRGESVAIIDYNILGSFLLNNQYSQNNNDVIRLLIEVDNLFFIDFGGSLKPDWYIQNYIINILQNRLRFRKRTLISSSSNLYSHYSSQLIFSRNEQDNINNKKIEGNVRKILRDNYNFVKIFSTKKNNVPQK